MCLWEGENWQFGNCFPSWKLNQQDGLKHLPQVCYYCQLGHWGQNAAASLAVLYHCTPVKKRKDLKSFCLLKSLKTKEISSQCCKDSRKIFIRKCYFIWKELFKFQPKVVWGRINHIQKILTKMHNALKYETVCSIFSVILWQAVICHEAVLCSYLYAINIHYWYWGIWGYCSWNFLF